MATRETAKAREVLTKTRTDLKKAKGKIAELRTQEVIQQRAAILRTHTMDVLRKDKEELQATTDDIAAAEQTKRWKAKFLGSVAARFQVQKEVTLWRDNYDKMTQNFETMRQVAEAWEGKYSAVRASADDMSSVSAQGQGLPTDMLELVAVVQDNAQASAQAQGQIEGGDDKMVEIVEGDWKEQLVSSWRRLRQQSKVYS